MKTLSWRHCHEDTVMKSYRTRTILHYWDHMCTYCNHIMYLHDHIPAATTYVPSVTTCLLPYTYTYLLRPQPHTYLLRCCTAAAQWPSHCWNLSLQPASPPAWRSAAEFKIDLGLKVSTPHHASVSGTSQFWTHWGSVCTVTIWKTGPMLIRTYVFIIPNFRGQ